MVHFMFGLKEITGMDLLEYFSRVLYFQNVIPNGIIMLVVIYHAIRYFDVGVFEFFRINQDNVRCVKNASNDKNIIISPNNRISYFDFAVLKRRISFLESRIKDIAVDKRIADCIMMKFCLLRNYFVSKGVHKLISTCATDKCNVWKLGEVFKKILFVIRDYFATQENEPPIQTIDSWVWVCQNIPINTVARCLCDKKRKITTGDQLIRTRVGILDVSVRYFR